MNIKYNKINYFVTFSQKKAFAASLTLKHVDFKNNLFQSLVFLSKFPYICPSKKKKL